MSAGGGSTKVIVIALGANLAIAAAKFVGAFISGSAALLAEAIHSVVDCVNQVLLLVGSKRASRPPTTLHPLGYGREAFFWSFIVAILLFSLGGLFAIYEGVHKFSHQEAMTSPAIGLGILFVALILESYSCWVCLKEVNAQNTHGSLWRWLRKTTSSGLLVIFTEDTAALVGLILATISLGLAWLTGNPVWDALGSIAIGIVLVVVAFFLAIEIKSLIIGEAPTTDFKAFVEERVATHIPGGRVFNIIALQLGADEVLLSGKLSAGKLTDVPTLLSAINQIERDIKQHHPEVKWLFMEPDTAD